VAVARKALYAGKAAQTLEKWIATTQEVQREGKK
jgi:hypothetical protein